VETRLPQLLTWPDSAAGGGLKVENMDAFALTVGALIIGILRFFGPPAAV